MEQSNEKDEEPKSQPLEDEVSSETIERGETLDKFIDKDSPFRRKKNKSSINQPLFYLTTANHLTLSLRKSRRERWKWGSLKSSWR